MKIALGLIFPGSLQDDSVICYLCKNYDISLNIIEASFSKSSGWAFLELSGKESQINQALAYMSSKDIKVQKLKTG
jgi:ABC-type methionine transport system ATPase subunit